MLLTQSVERSPGDRKVPFLIPALADSAYEKRKSGNLICAVKQQGAESRCGAPSQHRSDLSSAKTKREQTHSLFGCFQLQATPQTLLTSVILEPKSSAIPAQRSHVKYLNLDYYNNNIAVNITPHEVLFSHFI